MCCLSYLVDHTCLSRKRKYEALAVSWPSPIPPQCFVAACRMDQGLILEVYGVSRFFIQELDCGSSGFRICKIHILKSHFGQGKQWCFQPKAFKNNCISIVCHGGGHTIYYIFKKYISLCCGGLINLSTIIALKNHPGENDFLQ